MIHLKVILMISVIATGTQCLTAAPASVSMQVKPTQASYIPIVTTEPLSELIDITPNSSNRVSVQPEEVVTTLDRFFRVYEDGTIEYKIVLSNGFAQYQKITNKIVNGKTIQVYQGYNSELHPDKTYRTTYYIADENGYRLLRREFDTKPPVLPVYQPYVPLVSKGLLRK